MHQLTKTRKYISWLCQGLSALIMLQTLFFKFTGAEESVYIFSTLHAEPWGRWGSGFFELVASVLLLIPATVWLGAFLGIGIMSGALLAHFTVLGIEVKGDGGYLFFLGVTVFLCCALILLLRKSEIEEAVTGAYLKLKR